MKGGNKVGYIAPVTKYQYHQYAERDMIKRYDPYQFVPIKPIKPAVNPPEYQPQKLQANFQNFKKTSGKNQQVSHVKKDKLLSEITGKGMLYSYYV